MHRGRLLVLGLLLVSACGGGGTGGSGGKGGAPGRGGMGGAGKGGASGNGGATGGAGGMSGAGGSAGGTSGGAAGSGNTGGSGTSGAGGGGGGAGATGSGGAGAGGTAGAAGRGGSGAAGSGGATAGSGGAGIGGSPAGAGGGGTSGIAGATAGTSGSGGACTTSVSGTVYDPAGTLPLYNVSVYAPTIALTAFTEGVSCDRCGTLSGAPAAVTTSDTQGKFKLEGISPGTNVRLVFQIGKWRREVMVPNVAACTDTPLAANLTRLPRNQSEGHIPRIAMSTGAAEALECFLRRIGIADGEFTSDAGGGRVHLYAGGDGTNSFTDGGTFSAATTLWSNPTKLANYDIVLFSCEGSTSKFIDQKPQSSVDNVAAYANKGGRLLFTHLHVLWLQQAADFNATATYMPNLNPPTTAAGDVLDLTVNAASTKGMAFSQWLAGPQVAASTTTGKLPAAGLSHDVTSVNAPTTEWLYLPMNPMDSQNRRAVEFLSFQTPTTMPAANQCGKVLFADPHIKVSTSGAGGDDSDPSKPFPSGCKTNASTATMKALEYLFFDLGACL